MDPLSITVACIALGELMLKVSRTATSFMHDVRSAQADINAINSEFESIRTTIEILTEGFLQRTPNQLRGKILAIVGNYATIVNEVDEVLSRYQPLISNQRFQWAVSGKKELEKLKNHLNTHRHALNIALDTVKLVVIRDVRYDTIEIRRILEDDVAHIRQRIERIDQRLSPDRNDRKNGRLQQWLDDISCYAGSVVASTSTELNTAELRRRYGINPEVPPTFSFLPAPQATAHSPAPIRPFQQDDTPLETLPPMGTNGNRGFKGRTWLKGILKTPARDTATEYTPSYCDTTPSLSPATSQASLRKPKRKVLRDIFRSFQRKKPQTSLNASAERSSTTSLAQDRNSLEMYSSHSSIGRRERAARWRRLLSGRTDPDSPPSAASSAFGISRRYSLSRYSTSESERLSRLSELNQRKRGLISTIIEKIFH